MVITEANPTKSGLLPDASSYTDDVYSLETVETVAMYTLKKVATVLEMVVLSY